MPDDDDQRLRRWFDVTRHDRSVGIFERHLDTGEAYWDDRLCALSGLPPGTPAQRFEDFLAMVLPADRESVAQAWTASVETLRPMSSRYRLMRPDGSVRVLQADWNVQVDADGRRVAAGTVRDVTELQQTRRQAEVDRAQLTLAAEVARVGLIRHRLGDGRVEVSPAARLILGLPASGEVEVEALLARVHADDREHARRGLREPPAPGTDGERRYRVLGDDGRLRHVVARRALAPGDGRGGQELLVAVLDVTASLEADERERRLAQSRATALSVADVGVWEGVPALDAQGRWHWTFVFDDRLVAMLGRQGRPNRIGFDDWLALVHPEDRHQLQALAPTDADEGTERTATFRVAHADGTWRWLRSNWAPVRGADGRLVGLIGAARDETGRRELELRLRADHDLLAAMQRLAGVGTWRRIVATGELTWSPQLFEIFRRDPAAGMPTLEDLPRYFEPESWARLSHRIEHGLDSSTGGQFRLRIRRDDGTTGIVRSWTERLDDEHGQPVEFRGCQQDISETEQMREDVASARDRLQALFDEAMNAVVLTDDRSRIVDANPAACELLGYAREALLGLDEADLGLQPPQVQGESGWSRPVDERRRVGRAMVRRQDGRQVPIDFAAVANIRPGLHLRVFSDVSDQIKTELELVRARERLRELTLRQEADFEALRAELARDVHDELGQTLGALKLEIETVIGELPAEAVRRLDLARTRRLLGTAVGQVRDIARALRSPVLDLGLAPALRALAADVSLRSDVDVHVDMLDPAAAAIDRAVAEATYRIAQEALTNATRHADAHTVRIAVHQEPEALVLEVIDDGCGFDPGGPAAASGLGLLGMRERAHQIGARLRLDSRPGAGTQVHLRAPLTKRRPR